ncbi:MAG: hypothetical protein KGQ59_10095 [Bdellovibrionales bacterium]|nr:hypothetical protein [Bdellovibrionales bacterium]
MIKSLLAQIRGQFGLPEIALVALSVFFWSWVFQPYYTIPSVGDGLNHLAFVHFLREAKTWTLGNVPYSPGGVFGAEKIGFYPVGMHLVLAPFGGLVDVGLLLKCLAVLVLGLLPAIIFRGVRVLEPRLRPEMAFVFAASISTLLIFPGAPLGEGGLPRVVAQVLALPIAFFSLSNRVSFTGYMFSFAFVMPGLFFVHPSSLFIMFPPLVLSLSMRAAIFPNPRRIFLGIAASFGILLCFLPTRTGLVQDAVLGIGQEAAVSFTLGSAVDRFKGVFHFLFSDPHGWFKFMSIRSWVAYLGVFLLLWQPLRRRWLLLLVMPFALSLCILIPVKALQVPGALFYQQVKRISEMGFLPLVVCSVVGLVWVQERLKPRFHVFWISVWLVWSVVSAVKCRATIQQMAELYRTPRQSEVEDLRNRLKEVPSGAVMVSDDPWFGVIRGIRPDLVFVGSEGECSRRSVDSCVARARFVTQTKLDSATSNSTGRDLGASARFEYFKGMPTYFIQQSRFGNAVVLTLVYRSE